MTDDALRKWPANETETVNETVCDASETRVLRRQKLSDACHSFQLTAFNMPLEGSGAQKNSMSDTPGLKCATTAPSRAA